MDLMLVNQTRVSGVPQLLLYTDEDQHSTALEALLANSRAPESHPLTRLFDSACSSVAKDMM